MKENIESTQISFEDQVKISIEDIRKKLDLEMADSISDQKPGDAIEFDIADFNDKKIVKIRIDEDILARKGLKNIKLPDVNSPTFAYQKQEYTGERQDLVDEIKQWLNKEVENLPFDVDIL